MPRARSCWPKCIVDWGLAPPPGTQAFLAVNTLTIATPILSWPVRAPQEMMSGLNTSNAVVAFDKMEQKVLSMEAQAESTKMLVGSDTIDNKFKQLESGTGAWRGVVWCGVSCVGCVVWVWPEWVG